MGCKAKPMAAPIANMTTGAIQRQANRETRRADRLGRELAPGSIAEAATPISGIFVPGTFACTDAELECTGSRCAAGCFAGAMYAARMARHRAQSAKCSSHRAVSSGPNARSAYAESNSASGHAGGFEETIFAARRL